MQFDPNFPVSSPYNIRVAKQEKSQWIRINDGMPQEGELVPVWDGDFLYYATYWNKEGSQFWIVSQPIENTSSSFRLKKSPGEQVYPIQWMKIMEPTK